MVLISRWDLDYFYAKIDPTMSSLLTVIEYREARNKHGVLGLALRGFDERIQYCTVDLNENTIIVTL